MIRHSEIGKPSFATSRKLKQLIDNGFVKVGGNKNLKIYGTLACRSGKRMKTANRVFFSSEQEAVANGYRPCGHCMKKEYQDWKNSRKILNRQTAPEIKHKVALPPFECTE